MHSAIDQAGLDYVHEADAGADGPEASQEPRSPLVQALQALRDVRHMLPAQGVAIVDAAVNAANGAAAGSEWAAESILTILEGRGLREAPLFNEIPVFVN